MRSPLWQTRNPKKALAASVEKAEGRRSVTTLPPVSLARAAKNNFFLLLLLLLLLLDMKNVFLEQA